MDFKALKLSNLENFMALKASNLAWELWAFSIPYMSGGVRSDKCRLQYICHIWLQFRSKFSKKYTNIKFLTIFHEKLRFTEERDSWKVISKSNSIQTETHFGHSELCTAPRQALVTRYRFCRPKGRNPVQEMAAFRRNPVILLSYIMEKPAGNWCLFVKTCAFSYTHS